VKNESWYFQTGVAFNTIGSAFSARVLRYASAFDVRGSCVFPENPNLIVAVMNSRRVASVLESLNPGVNFQVGDVNRLPLYPVQDAETITARVAVAFSEHEAAREASVEFACPSPSDWSNARNWAQSAIDRPEGTPLPEYDPQYDPPAPVDFVSFSIGVALGRFSANGEGILDKAPRTALPAGILYVSAASEHDSLQYSACAPLHAAWAEHSKAVGEGDDLRTWLRTGFFKHHKAVYENRSIYFPLSSAKKSFVAWISIHRWDASTLTKLLADHLVPERRRLEGELDDLRKAKAKGEKGRAGAERRFAEVQKLHGELVELIDLVTECAERGPPSTTPDETKREQDARYEMDLDDGVMVNSAALWPLLEPQWKDPRKWWKELAEAKGRKDYDWAHLARRYFPKRVEAECANDPSLAVAHGCFWRLHPEKAYAWELRLQDEIRPDFNIDEPGADAARKAFLKSRAEKANAIREKEQERRERKARKAGEGENLSLALEEDGGPAEPEADEAEG
jgi:hypothetical protein